MITPVPESSGSRKARSTQCFPPRRAGTSDEGRGRSLDIFSSVRRHLPVFLVIFFALVGCGAFVLRMKAKPVYSSQSVVYISPKFPKVLNTDSEVELPYDSYFEDQIQTVTRYDIISDAISQLPKWVRGRSGQPQPGETAKLQHSLDVKRIGTSYEMSIGLLGPSPDGLAETVNAITNSYVERAKNEEFFGLGDRLNTLRQERRHLQEQIDADLAEQADLMEQLGVATVSTGPGATNPYDASSDTVRSQLGVARMQREAAEAQLDASIKNEGSGQSTTLDTAAEEMITTDPGLSQIWSTLNNRRALLMEEMSTLRTDHPIYQKDKGELTSIEKLIDDLKQKATAQLQSKLRREVERTRLVEIKLTQELDKNTHSATSAAPKFQRATELGPVIDSLQKTYETIDNRIRDLELESSSPGSVHVSTKALTPTSPEPNKLLLYSVALFLTGLGSAAAVVIGIDFFDNRIHTAEDIESVVGFHPIGVLLDTNEFSDEVAEEYFFRLAAGIDNAVCNGGARSFLFTSSAHEAGTSTVIKRLSEELRALNLKTRTIRAATSGGTDGSRRRAFSRPELLLREWNDGDETQQAAFISGVSFNRPPLRMDGDAPPARSAEQALQQASVGYDVVLIDSDPMPTSANTEYLARAVDATVIVVKAGTTTKQELRRAARLLERLQVAGIAVVLNKIQLERADRDLRRELRGLKQRRSKKYLSVTPAVKPTVPEKRTGTTA